MKPAGQLVCVFVVDNVVVFVLTFAHTVTVTTCAEAVEVGPVSLVAAMPHCPFGTVLVTVPSNWQVPEQLKLMATHPGY